MHGKMALRGWYRKISSCPDAGVWSGEMALRVSRRNDSTAELTTLAVLPVCPRLASAIQCKLQYIGLALVS